MLCYRHFESIIRLEWQWDTVALINTPDDSKRRGPAYYTQRLMIPFDDLYRGRWKVKQAFLRFLTGFWKFI